MDQNGSIYELARGRPAFLHVRIIGPAGCERFTRDLVRAVSFGSNEVVARGRCRYVLDRSNPEALLWRGEGADVYCWKRADGR